MRQLVDIQSARGNIGRDQHPHLAFFKTSQRFRTRCLTFIAMDSRSMNAILAQLFGQPVGAVFGACKHQHLSPVLAGNQMRQHGSLACLFHPVHNLPDLPRRFVPGHFDQHGITQNTPGQLLDIIGKCRRKQQVLPLLRQQRQYLANIVNESHIEHAIRLIKHQHVNLR